MLYATLCKIYIIIITVKHFQTVTESHPIHHQANSQLGTTSFK